MNAQHSDSAAQQDKDHLWHPFTPMRQWRESDPLVIESGDGFYIQDTNGKRYIDGTSSLWCNVFGHRVEAIDTAIRQQLDRIAHSTLLGLANVPSAQLAARLVEKTPGKLNKVFYSDAGATAVEVAFKMAVGCWHHRGFPEKHRIIGLQGAYHGDTVGTMSVGYSELFHRAFKSMVFPVDWFPAPDSLRPPENYTGPTANDCPKGTWPSQWEPLTSNIGAYCLDALESLLVKQSQTTAALCIEPLMQGAAGMICQPTGFLKKVAELCKEFNVLLIADEVATGFARTGSLFACEHEQVQPDILCCAKGITGGYLPLAATLTTDFVEDAFCGELEEKKTLFHGHTYTGNPLACAAALATLDLIDQPHGDSPDLISHTRKSAALITEMLEPLHDSPCVLDIRQRGLMVGIELGKRNADGSVEPFDFSKRTAFNLCLSLREKGLLVRPLGDVMTLMPAPAMDHDTLKTLVSETVDGILNLKL